MNTISPETDKSCHYFWAFMRNYRLESQLITTQLRNGVSGVFTEDEDMLEAHQAAIDANPDYEFYNLNIDAGGMWVRRLIESRLAAEGRDAEGWPLVALPAAGFRATGRGRTVMAATNNEVWQWGTVVELEDVATDVRRIVIEPSLPITAQPGSHIDLFVTIEGERAKRSYSVVESSDDGTRLVISVFRAPQSRGGSIAMHSLELGDRLELTQPLQNFPLRVGAERYVLLAGGIGITAMVAMARVLKRLGARYTFVYAGRNRAAMAYLSELRQLHGDNIVVHVDDEGSSLQVDQLLADIGGDAELYMCGPIRLMDAVRRQWRDRGLELPNLRYETFGNSGWFDPEEFTVRIPRLGVEAVVGKGRSMLEALEEAGVEMMFDCRKGECGLCEVRVLQLEGTIDHRDVFYSERQQHAAEKMCCCVSRAVAAPAGVGGRASVTIEVS